MAEDKHGFTIKEPPKGAEAVLIAIKNAEHLCGLDRTIMGELIKGEYTDSTTLDHNGRTSKKIVIEYDIQQKS